MAGKNILSDLIIEGKILAKQLDLTTALDTNQSYAGVINTITVGEAVTFGDVLYLKFSDGKWWKAKADSYTTTPATVMALGSISTNNTGLAIAGGFIRFDSWAFAAANIWLSADTAGAITSTQPSTAGNQIQKIGVALASNILHFKPSTDIGEI